MGKDDRVPGCVFCDPAIRDSAFAETDRFLAIYDIAPILPGHSLVLPKRHVVSLMDLTDEELAAFAVFGRKVTRIVSAAFAATGLNWALQDREEAGQSVPHLHLHVIPRRSGDLPDPGNWYTELERRRLDLQKRQLGPHAERARPRLTPEEMREVTSYLKGVAARLDP